MKDGIPTYGPIRSSDIIFQAGGNVLKGLHIKLVEKSISTEHPVFIPAARFLVQRLL